MDGPRDATYHFPHRNHPKIIMLYKIHRNINLIRQKILLVFTYVISHMLQTHINNTRPLRLKEFWFLYNGKTLKICAYKSRETVVAYQFQSFEWTVCNNQHAIPMEIGLEDIVSKFKYTNSTRNQRFWFWYLIELPQYFESNIACRKK